MKKDIKKKYAQLFSKEKACQAVFESRAFKDEQLETGRLCFCFKTFRFTKY